MVDKKQVFSCTTFFFFKYFSFKYRAIDTVKPKIIQTPEIFVLYFFLLVGARHNRKINTIVTYYTPKFYIQWTTCKMYKRFGTKNLSDTLTWPCFALIDNVTFLHHRLNKIEHCLVTGWPKLVLSNCVLTFNSWQLINLIHYIPFYQRFLTLSRWICSDTVLVIFYYRFLNYSK